MKFSVITICYNSEETILDTLNSVYQQNYGNIEHIIIDGMSRDNTLSIVQNHANPAIRLFSGPDAGIYDAINKGIEKASGDIIAILHSDDTYNNAEVISDIVTQFKNQDPDCLYGDLVYVSRDDPDKITRLWVAGELCREKFRYGWMPPHPAFFVKRSAYEKWGRYNPNFRYSGDYELMLRYLYKLNLSSVYIPKVLVKMKEGGLSNKSIISRLKANKEDKAAWDINQLPRAMYTTILKPLRKISQYFIKNRR